MANIPGAPNTLLPDVYSTVETISSGASVPGGIRVACVIGEGSHDEVIVASAVGGGNDGLNATYTSATGADGRHFLLSNFPVQSNRTTLYKNGIPLVGIEQTISSAAFSNLYDYRLDITTGEIELQKSRLVDQGGSFYSAGATNVGVGVIQSLTLVDSNAPTETWTIKCVSVQRNSSNQPIAGTATFVAFGSVSGNVRDGYGNTVKWVADNTVSSNTILSFSIQETASTPFRQGDYFTVKVYGGVLNKNDSLTANYIPVANINDPTFFTSMKDIVTKHGTPSLTNTLSLGMQLAFANSPPGMMALQAAPPLPRRVSYELTQNFPATSTNIDDFVIPLPINVSPDIHSDIHIFVTNTTTNVETQLLPNKYTFYTLGTTGYPTVNSFVFDNTSAPSGNSFSYSVIQQGATLNTASDGYLNRFNNTQIDGYFSSASVTTFDSSYVGKEVTIWDAVNATNNGTFSIVGVTSGVLHIQATGTPPFTAFTNETSLTFHLYDPVLGTTVAASSATDGYITAASGSTASFSSLTLNFNGFSPQTYYKLQITSGSNIGLYDITGYNASTNLLSIAKSFVSEHNLRFEVIDPSQTSDYLVLNHNVVPNGNNLRVTIVDTKDASFYDAGWETALASLESQEIDILIPLPTQTISVIFQNSLSHCLAMSNVVNKKERVLFIGAINGLTPDNLTGAKLAAVENLGVLEGIQGATVADVLAGNTEDLANYSVSAAYGSTYRCVYFAPDQIVVQVGSDNQVLSGYYIAAAAGGWCAANSNVAMPLTNKILSGFSILKSRMYSATVYRNLVGAGVATLQPVAGGGKVLWGITTTQSGYPEEQEISIVFIRDRVAKSMRAGFVGYIGMPEDSDTIPTLTARATALLNGFVGQGLITDYANLTVTRDSVDPRQWNVSVLIQPSYPINWIYLKIGVGTVT